MAEWSIAAVLKTVEGQTSGGSNPSLSAETKTKDFTKAFKNSIKAPYINRLRCFFYIGTPTRWRLVGFGSQSSVNFCYTGCYRLTTHQKNVAVTAKWSPFWSPWNHWFITNYVELCSRNATQNLNRYENDFLSVVLCAFQPWKQTGEITADDSDFPEWRNVECWFFRNLHW